MQQMDLINSGPSLSAVRQWEYSVLQCNKFCQLVTLVGIEGVLTEGWGLDGD